MSRHRRPEGFQRTDRISDQIQRELSRLLQFEMKDPRVRLVTITEVRVSRDLAWSDVYFTLLDHKAGDEQGIEEVLMHAAGFLRTRLAGEMTLRTVPRLRFHYDKVPEQADHMSQLLAQAREKDSRTLADLDSSDESGQSEE